MFNFLKNKGFSIDGFGLSASIQPGGEFVFYISLLNINLMNRKSLKTFEIKYVAGRFHIWHVALFPGLVVGRSMQHDVDDAGMIQGPDYPFYYWFVSCFGKEASFGDMVKRIPFINRKPKAPEDEIIDLVDEVKVD